MNRPDAQRALRAGKSLVSGFPEIVARHARCRLCQLVDNDPDFLRYMNQKWLGGWGVRKLETELTASWSERGELPADHRSYHRHFRKHCDFNAGRLAPVTVALPVDPIASLSADFVDMDHVLAKLRDRMALVDDNTAFVDDEGKVNGHGISTWLKLISEFRAAIESMARMKNSERLIKAILQSHTKRMAQLISAPLVERFEVVVTAMRDGADGAIVASEIERLASSDIKSLILSAAETAVAESCETFKLH